MAYRSWRWSSRAAAAKPSRTGATGSTYPSHSPRQPSGTGMREVSRGSTASTTSLSEPPFPSCFEPGRAPISTGASSSSSSSTVTRSLSSRPLRSVASSPAGEEPPYGSARWHSVQSPSSSSPGTLRHGTSPMASSRSLLSRSQHQWAFSACWAAFRANESQRQSSGRRASPRLRMDPGGRESG